MIFNEAWTNDGMVDFLTTSLVMTLGMLGMFLFAIIAIVWMQTRPPRTHGGQSVAVMTRKVFVTTVAASTVAIIMAELILVRVINPLLD